MPKVRKAEDGFNLAFLDVMACGLGAVILIFILVDFKAFTPTPTEEKEKLEQELAAAEQEQRRGQPAHQSARHRLPDGSGTEEVQELPDNHAGQGLGQEPEPEAAGGQAEQPCRWPEADAPVAGVEGQSQTRAELLTALAARHSE